MRTRTLFVIPLILMTAILLVACSKESSLDLTETSTDDVEKTDVEAPATPVRVFVNNQSLFATAGGAWARRHNLEDTRGIGTFQMLKDEDIADKLLSDEEKLLIKEKFERTNFYIYAFRDKTSIKPVYDVPDFRRYSFVNEDNPLAHAPGTNFADNKDRWHCLIDGQDYYKGLLANLPTDKFQFKTPYDKKTGERKVIYWPDRIDCGYNFFAYSIGDISTDDFSTEDQSVDWGTPQRLEDQVVYRNFTVDGSQDIMAGYAPPIEYTLNSVSNLTPIEKEQIKQFGYSTFAAQRGIDPKINLHHLMTRIRFRGVAGDETSQHTSIHSIHVKCYNKGDFIVAHRDTNQVGFHPYTQSTDMMGDVYVHDKTTFVYDETGKAIGLVPAKTHDTEGFNENGDPLVSRDDCWHVDWLDSFYEHADPAHPNTVTGKVDLSERLKYAVDFGDDLLLPPSDSLNIYIKSYYRNEVSPVGGNLNAPKKYDTRSFTSHYIVKAADIVKANPQLEKLFLDDKYYKETGEKRYIFKPGYFYTLTHVVYGLSITTTDANIDAWQEGVTDITMDERSGEQIR